MVKTISIFLTTIINKSLFILFILNRPKNFAIKIKITNMIICKIIRGIKILHLLTKFFFGQMTWSN